MSTPQVTQRWRPIVNGIAHFIAAIGLVGIGMTLVQRIDVHTTPRGLRYSLFSYLLLGVSFNFILAVYEMFVISQGFSYHYCKEAWLFAVTAYVVMLLILGIYFTYKCDYPFRKTAFAYSNVILTLIRIGIILLFSALIIVSDLTLTIKNDCLTAAPFWSHCVVGVLVTLFGGGLLAMFVYKLHEMREAVDEINRHIRAELYILMSKNTLLSMLGVVSSALLVGIVAPLSETTHICTAIDTLVNAGCLYLSFSANNDLFETMFSGCMPLCFRRYKRSKAELTIKRPSPKKMTTQIPRHDKPKNHKVGQNSPRTPNTNNSTPRILVQDYSPTPSPRTSASDHAIRKDLAKYSSRESLKVPNALNLMRVSSDSNDSSHHHHSDEELDDEEIRRMRERHSAIERGVSLTPLSGYADSVTVTDISRMDERSFAVVELRSDDDDDDRDVMSTIKE